MQKCPRCKKLNDDNWPLDSAGKIENGGCQMCWEAECSEKWWDMVETLAALTEREDEGHK
jgi:hypothetical protein